MLDDYSPPVITHGPDESKAFGGLTPQQYAYCRLRSQGAAKLYAYREAFENDHSTDAVIQDAAWKLEANARISQTINRMVTAEPVKTTLVPKVTKSFVLEGITAIATKEQAKDNVRLRAYELLGKAVGLFKDEAPAPDKPRTIEEIDNELRERLSAMKSIEGSATRIDPKPEQATPAQTTGDRRRKPKT